MPAPRRNNPIALILAGLLALPGGLLAQDFYTLKGHGGPIMGLDVAGDGRVATASFDNAVGLWLDRRPTWLDGHTAAVTTVLFANGLLYSGSDDFTLRQWPSGQVIGHHQGKITALAALPDGIASASWDGTVKLWRNGAIPALTLSGHTAGVNALALGHDRGHLYSASADGTIRLWDLADGTEQVLLVRHGFGINRMILAPDGAWLAYGAVDGATRVVDPGTGAELADITLDRRPILAMALSPDGRQLAVGDGQGYIMVLDTADWTITRDFRATLHGPIWVLAFAADGHNILAGGLENLVYSWPLDRLQQGQKMGANAPPRFLANPAGMDNGERQFARKCAICHTVTAEPQRRAGPTLHGLFGRRAGTVPGYRYSAVLDGSDIVWDDTTIDALFDLGPDHYIPGTKMPMQRLTNPDDRADLITYLRRATATENPK